MRLAISLISSLLVIYTGAVDLVERPGHVANRSQPIILDVCFCGDREDTINILGGRVRAVLDETRQYIIGVLRWKRVCPLFIQTEPMEYRMVKVRLDGGPIANITEEIPVGDPLRNRFWKRPKQLPLIKAEIPVH